MENSGNISGKILTQKQKTPDYIEPEIFEFDVIGMDCTSCAKSIKTYLTKINGISGVEINYASETGEVIYNSDLISRETIKKEIKTLGYDISSEDEEYESEQIRKTNLAKQKKKIITSIALSRIIMG
ncbi:MAG: heavy metal-associated domain-containing protein, partial [bacterium]